VRGERNRIASFGCLPPWPVMRLFYRQRLRLRRDRPRRRDAPTGLAALRLGRRDEQWDHDEWIRVSKFAIRRTCILQKLNKQLAHLFRLLLLQPVTGSVYKVDAAHLRARGILHGLE
jgi:hypothetical protein